MLLKRIPKPQKRTERWKSQAHLSHVRKHACVNCGLTANIEAAHVRIGSDAAMGRKPSDFYAVPLCGGLEGCHSQQHTIGERTFWLNYKSAKGYTVEDVQAELILTSPRRGQIEQEMRERGL